MTIFNCTIYGTLTIIQLFWVMKMNYEDLLKESEYENLIVKEKPLKYSNGRIMGNRIAIRKDMLTVEKKCALAEELGHHYTSSGDILDQSLVSNRKQEHRAKFWAFRQLVSLFDIIRAHEYGCQNLYEMAEYLEVSENFLRDTIKVYRAKYGTGVKFDNYRISFEPYLTIVKCFK